jgi:hypothetical protein
MLTPRSIVMAWQAPGGFIDQLIADGCVVMLRVG